MNLYFKETNTLNNFKLSEHNLNSTKSSFLETTAIVHNETSCSKLLAIEKPNLQLLKKNIQNQNKEYEKEYMSQNNQDVTEINYSQFQNKLINEENYNSTFQKDNNFIVQGNIITEI